MKCQKLMDICSNILREYGEEGYYFGAFCAVLSFFGFWEFSKMVGEDKKLLGILGLVLTGAIYLFLFLGYPEKTDLVVALSLLL